MAMTSSGVGSFAAVVVPYRASCRAVRPAAGTLVESTTIREVGAYPVTGAGVVVMSHENAIASGESLIVA